MKPTLLVHGMLGLGDNLHQRAILPQLMETNDVVLESTWVSLYHDLIERGLKVTKRDTTLASQQANLKREQYKFSAHPGRATRAIKIWYDRNSINRCGSILGAMCDSAKVKVADFQLPVPIEWHLKLDAAFSLPNDKPILFYRPLVERTEWIGCSTRNPDKASYKQLIDLIRDKFFVVSVARLHAKEWLSGIDIEPDLKLHKGELDFEMMAALAARSAMVFCSAGFALVLGAAVKVPTVCVFGGRESSKSYRHDAQFTDFLGIDPIIPCDCFSHTHACKKQINMDKAKQNLRVFTDATLNRASATQYSAAIGCGASNSPRRDPRADRPCE